MVNQLKVRRDAMDTQAYGSNVNTFCKQVAV